jgi:hypothetical protein
MLQEQRSLRRRQTLAVLVIAAVVLIKHYSAQCQMPGSLAAAALGRTSRTSIIAHVYMYDHIILLTTVEIEVLLTKYLVYHAQQHYCLNKPQCNNNKNIIIYNT